MKNIWDSAAVQRVVGVAELNRLAKEIVETNLPLMWVSGEISNFVRAASGHCYFSLKDANARLDAVAAVFAARTAEAKEAEEKAKGDLVVKLQRMSDRAKRVAEADQITLREGERLMKDVRELIDEAAGLDRKDVNEAAATLRGWLEKVAPRVRDLREMDDWRRFANAQQQERLILEAETLVAKLAKEEQEGQTSDLAAAARHLRDFVIERQQTHQRTSVHNQVSALRAFLADLRERGGIASTLVVESTFGGRGIGVASSHPCNP